MSQSKTIWLFVLAVLITALVVGGVVYFGQQNILKDKEDEAKRAQERIAELESQLAQFQESQNSQNKLQVPQIQDWKTYTNEDLGIDIMYPDTIFKVSTTSSELYHEMSNFHQKSNKDGSDLGLAKDMRISFDQKVDQNCANLEKTLKDSGVQFAFQNIKGIKYDTGVEGEGVVSYCVQDNKGKDILLISRYYLSEAYSTEITKEADFINSDAQSQLFDLMLQTMKIKDYDISGLTYENTKYKFTLKFPDSWKGYVAGDKQKDWGKNGKSDSVEFAFGSDAPLLTISMLTKDQWKKIKLLSDAPTLIAEDTKNSYVYSVSQTAKDDTSTQRLSVLKNIIASFELE